MPHILAADIGGTSSRFGFFDAPSGGGLRLQGEIVRLRTGEAASFGGLLARLFAEPRPFAAAACDLAALAVPGPVQDGVCVAPNIRWRIDLAELGQAGLARGALLNDFAAQAFACRSGALAGAVVLQRGRRPFGVGGVVAVVGAGTGLGHCALTPDGRGGLLAVPSEGGHMAFPFVGDAEHAYGEQLRRAAGIPYCHGDAVVTGSGLARLHEHLTGEALTPAEVGARLERSPRTVEWFARFYGRVARNYALAVMALGGVCISGGVAARNPVLVQHPAFLAEFRSAPSAGHAELLAGLPVVLNRDEDFGVHGAALFGMQLLERD